MTLVLALIAAAAAAPCVFAGNRADYVDCIAAQSAANEDLLVDVDDRLRTLEVGAVSVPGVALRPDRAGSTLAVLTNGATYAVALGDTFGLGMVSLPDGATVDALDCTIRDEDPVGYVTLSLQRSDRTNPSVFSDSFLTFVATTPSTDSADYLRYASATDPATSVVDNATYTYFLRADLLDVTAIAANVAVQGCSVSFHR